MTELVHPRGLSKEPSFTDFEVFVNTGNAPALVKQQFRDFLSDLHRETGKLWIPTNCLSIPEIEVAANEIISRCNFPVKLAQKSFSNGKHLWLTVKLGDYNRNLVVDPTGIAPLGVDPRKNPEKILPFFGDYDFVNPPAKHIYAIGDR